MNNRITTAPWRRLPIFFISLGLFFSISNQCMGEGFTLRGYRIGDPLPSFKTTTITTQRNSSFSPKGDSPAIIIFFSVSPLFRQKRSFTLISEIQDLIDKEFSGKVRLALVFSDNHEKKTLRKLIADGLIPTPVYDDSKMTIYHKFGVFMTPIVVISNNNGTLHEVLPATYNIKKLLRNNIKLLLGEWSQDEFKNSFKPTYTKKWTKEEKEYLRHINYGKIMYSRKMYSPATREFTTAAKINPNALEAQLGLGQVYLKTQKYPKAVKAFTLALKSDMESTAALAGLGVTYFRMGKTAKAIRKLESALISDDPDIDAIISLAQIYEEQGNIEKAMRLNKMAVFKLQSQFK